MLRNLTILNYFLEHLYFDYNITFIYSIGLYFKNNVDDGEDDFYIQYPGGITPKENITKELSKFANDRMRIYIEKKGNNLVSTFGPDFFVVRL